MTAAEQPKTTQPRLLEPSRLHTPPIVNSTFAFLHLDITGIAFAALFFCWSLTPSLLPRDWLFGGIIGGITAAIGYGVGVVVGKIGGLLLRNRVHWPLREPWNTGLKSFVVLASAGTSLAVLLRAASWQRDLAALMGTEATTTSGYTRTLAISLLIAATLVAIYRTLREVAIALARKLIRWFHLSIRVALTIGTAVVVLGVGFLVNVVALRGAYSAVNNAFSLENEGTMEGISQPTNPLRSGSPASLVPWDSLGLQGRNFVSRGLHADALTESSGRVAREPIRVYAGLDSAKDPDQRMDLIVKELERTGAFQRKVLAVVPTTGTGWVNPTAAEAIELVGNGDTAIVASQYSVLPSWVSFVTDRQKAMDAGKRLVDAVRARWLQEPEATRPKLLVYGESLGTMAGEGAFSSLEDLRTKVDGVLWAGPPNANPLWTSLVSRRDPGSPQVDPVYADEVMVRFANNLEDLQRSAEKPWLSPRVLYLQHPSDPVVWWSPDLLFNRPDWLREAPGFDRSASMRWFPIVTFWQVSADLGNAAGVPDGHGHNYGTLVLDAWVQIAQPEGWTQADTDRAKATLVAYRGTQGPEK